MAKWVCKLCKLKIRRPVDHVYCIGALDSKHLEEYKKPSPSEITQEIIIPKEIRNHK